MAAINFYTPFNMLQTIAYTGADYASRCYSILTASLRSLGDATVSLIHRCTTNPKQQVPNLPYPAFYINDGVKRRIGEVIGQNKDSFPGIIKNRGGGFFDDYRCTDYVSDRVHTDIGLYESVEKLEKIGYQATATPQEGDIIYYFHSDNISSFRHVGIVSKVENNVVWIESKWGKMDVYEHLEEAVPLMYGNAVVYLHKGSIFIKP